MLDRAPEIARALAEGEIDFYPLQDLPRLLRQRWPDLTRNEMERGLFIAIECDPPPLTIPGGGAGTIEPVISDLRRVDPRPNPIGTVLVARFTCRVGGLLLLGVKLLRQPNGDLSVSNVVSGGGRSGTARGALIEDERLRAAILTAATSGLGFALLPDSETPRRHRGQRAAGR